MSTPPQSEQLPPLRRPRRFSRRRMIITPCSHRLPRARSEDTKEAAFWKQFEEREEGRHAQEADHLFDTSAPWAF